MPGQDNGDLFRQGPEAGISMPGRSWLIPLEPIGGGTALVESLTSYVTRLAMAHSVSVLDLLDFVVSRTPVGSVHKKHTPPGRASLAQLVLQKPETLNGIDDRAYFIRLGLLGLTGCTTLDRLTAEPLFGLSLPPPILGDRAAWCPYCFQEWQDKGEALYEPLLWKLQLVTACPVHGQPLAQTCHVCKSSVRHLGECRTIGWCEKCATWLGKRPKRRVLGSTRSAPQSLEAIAALQTGILLAFVNADTVQRVPCDEGSHWRDANGFDPHWSRQDWLASLSDVVLRHRASAAG